MRARQDGQGLVEFALIAPLLLMLVFGIIYFGIGLNYWLDMNRVANQGARQAAVNHWPTQCQRGETACNNFTSTTPCATVMATNSKARLQEVLRCQTRNDATATICFPGKTPATATIGDPVKVKLSKPFTFFFMNRLSITLTGTATMRLEQLPTLLPGECGRPGMPMRGDIFRRQKERERGQVLVLVALLMPLLLAIGSIVIDVGNWYVLKRHLQTQVDAAALAGGPAFTGCFQNPIAARDAIAQQALAYAGDRNPLRDPSAHNPLMEEKTADVHAVLNSNTFWSDGDPSDGSTLDWTAGMPCDTKYLDVKATDDDAPLLWKWIPFFPDIKTRARVEVTEIQSSNGMRPLGVPELDPEEVAVLVVDEDGDPDVLGTIRGRVASRPPVDSSGRARRHVRVVQGLHRPRQPQRQHGLRRDHRREVAVRPRSRRTESLSQICSPGLGAGGVLRGRDARQWHLVHPCVRD